MTQIIDNSRSKLSDILNVEFKESEEIAIASAFFNVRGYSALKEGLNNKPMRFLLGSEPTQSIKWEETILKELEENEDDLHYYHQLRETINYFESDKRQVKIFDKKFFHGKAYIGYSDEFRRSVGVVGSSNFTYGGLCTNQELNMLDTDREAIKELASWFDTQWNSSIDYKEKFLSFLKNYSATRTPYEVVAKALYEIYRNDLETSENRPALKTLHPHQVLSHNEAREKLRQYGGVIIADSTGLGKSRVVLNLIADAHYEERKAILIAPKSIIETTWENEMNETHIHVPWISSEDVSHDPEKALEVLKDVDLIVIDEAHYFRNPSTNRYIALSEIIAKNKAQVVLATATPVNNSLMDLYFLLSLYLSEDCISDIKNQTLKDYFVQNQKRAVNNQSIDMDQVLSRFLVRHSRELAKALDKEGKIKFPERFIDKDPKTRYATGINYEKIDAIMSGIENDGVLSGGMNFAFYELSVDRLSGEFRLPDGTTIAKSMLKEQKDNLKALIKRIVILNLFKRLESSVYAFNRSLCSIDEYIQKSIQYAKKTGYFAPPALRNRLIFGIDDGSEDADGGEDCIISPDALFEDSRFNALRDRLKLTKEEISEYERKCDEDRKAIKKILGVIPSQDAKFQSFKSRIEELPDEMNKSIVNNGIIIFTQYADTANYLFDLLSRERLSLPIMMTTGQRCTNSKGKTSRKTDIVKEFCNDGGILISTDVLSAGQNLQNAQYVVNYDFPWNPVTLIQRAGRIDRMGSLHNAVYLMNILPRNGDEKDPQSLEHFIRLMKKLYYRLDAIRSTVGLDATQLGEAAAPKDFGIQMKLAQYDQHALDGIMEQYEQFTNSPLDTLAKIMNEKGIEWLKSIPKGIGACKKGTPPGLFILFTDGEDFYWRMKQGDRKITDPNAIITALLKDANKDKPGTTIPYDKLIGQMSQMKEDLDNELNAAQMREATLEGVTGKVQRAVKEIYEALSRIEKDGELLAAAFRDSSQNQNIIRILGRALKEGNLPDKARELLRREEDDEEEKGETAEQEYVRELHRVCWCWFEPE